MSADKHRMSDKIRKRVCKLSLIDSGKNFQLVLKLFGEWKYIVEM